MWLIKEVFYQRKRHYLTTAAVCISIILVLLVNIISSHIIENVHLSFEQLGLNISCLQLLKKRSYNWIEKLIESNQIEKYSLYHKKQEGDYKIIGCQSSLAEIFTFNFESGHFLTETGNMYNDNQVVIGNKLKQYFNCYQINESIIIKGITFRVVGILEEDCENLYEDFDKCVFIFIDYLNKDSQSGVYFLSENRLNERYLNELLGKDNFLFIDQSQTKDALINLLDLIRNVLIVLAFVSVSVSIICIVSNSLSGIDSRMKEIGIKKALGASSKDIYLQFIVENTVIIIIGIFISWLTVLIIVKMINLYAETKVAVDIVSNTGYIILILIIGSICNIYPAKKASEITIIETIKNRGFN